MPERSWSHEVLPHQADKRQSAIMACMAVLHIMQDDTARLITIVLWGGVQQTLIQSSGIALTVQMIQRY